jgi:hypothetical protein
LLPADHHADDLDLRDAADAARLEKVLATMKV